MHVVATAPGKLIVAGDYAVLEGAPAIVLALDRRARVEAGPSPDDAFHVAASEVRIDDARAPLVDGRLQWTSGDIAERLALVTAVIEALAHALPVTPMQLTLDTGAFFDAATHVKLGLGSSAALTVALAGAVHAACGCAPPDPARMLAMHRELQGGRGSGVDIAASLRGGALVYQLRDGEPAARSAQWPRDLAFQCVWSGRAASTGAALAQLGEWRHSHPAAYKTRMDELRGNAATAAAALDGGDAAAMLEALADYAQGLARLGAATGIDIVCAEHRALGDLARQSGVTYKTCGAGGGDIGLALALDADRLTRFCRQATAAGFQVLETGIDVRGLLVDAPVTNERSSAWTTYA